MRLLRTLRRRAAPRALLRTAAPAASSPQLGQSQHQWGKPPEPPKTVTRYIDAACHAAATRVPLALTPTIAFASDGAERATDMAFLAGAAAIGAVGAVTGTALTLTGDAMAPEALNVAPLEDQAAELSLDDQATALSDKIDVKLREYGLEKMEELDKYRALLEKATEPGAIVEPGVIAKLTRNIAKLEPVVACVPPFPKIYFSTHGRVHRLNDKIIFGEGSKTLAEVAALAVIVKSLGTVDLPNEYKLYVDVAAGEEVPVCINDIEY